MYSMQVPHCWGKCLQHGCTLLYHKLEHTVIKDSGFMMTSMEDVALTHGSNFS